MKLATIIAGNTINLNQLKSDRELLTEIQTILAGNNLLKGKPIDGIWGPNTQNGVNDFCKVMFLNSMETGQFGKSFAERLLDIAPRLSTTNKLEIALKFTLKWEGGKVDITIDPGGRTNRGITQRVYNSYRASKGLSQKDVFESTFDETKDIYKRDYWTPSKAETMVTPLAVVMFDSAVLLGLGGATSRLQEALGIAVDGGFGPQTLNKLQSNNNKTTALKMIDKRIAFHHRIVAGRPASQVFLNGWLNRCNNLKTFINGL